MKKFALGAVLWLTVLALGGFTAVVQVGNFDEAAELDRMVDETHWNRRRCSGLEADLERFEFELSAQHTRGHGEGAALPSR